MSRLSKEDRRELLGIARKAIGEAVSRQHEHVSYTERQSLSLKIPGGAFVTLKHRQRLRGCVGQPFALDPLAETVARCAVLAATSDERFSPISTEEVSELEIEISVLSAPATIAAEQIEIGIHGLLVHRGRYRGLLLPQVATEHRWTRERFLSETCEKAGLAPDAWKHPDTILYGFTAEIFCESELASEFRETLKP
jgi:AmmeMemoRadiSam system protein A